MHQMIKIMQITVKTMYHISLPILVNMPPNKPFASLMTSHNRGIATANIIKVEKSEYAVTSLKLNEMPKTN